MGRVSVLPSPPCNDPFMTAQLIHPFCRPVLVNVSSFRCIIGFAMSFRATNWIEERGFLGSFSIYAAVLAVFSALLPLIFVYGRRIRQWASPALKKGNASNEEKG